MEAKELNIHISLPQDNRSLHWVCPVRRRCFPKAIGPVRTEHPRAKQRLQEAVK